jgi:translocation and assembly module TamA
MNYSLDLKRERSEIAGERQDAVLVIPGVTWSRVYAEDDAHALGDYRLGVDLHGGSTALGSDVSFVQLRLDGKLIVAAPWRGGRLLGRLELGTTWTDDFGALPVSERFFAGGDQSIRGYAWKSLGPVGSSGKVVGGRNLAVGSLEYEHYFTDKWGVALFQDIGYAFDAASDPFYRGRGIGLRWRSPIGTVRLDVAQAQDGSREPWRLHFVVGPDL